MENLTTPASTNKRPSRASSTASSAVLATPAYGTANSSAAAPASAEDLEDAALRERLRPIFDSFDEDGSGTVDTVEMGHMIKMLGMDMTSEEIVQLMVDADPDGSGEIDFDEFVMVLKLQLADGKTGGLVDVFSGAANLLGFLNPVGWFNAISNAVSAPAPAPAPEPPTPSSASSARNFFGYVSPGRGTPKAQVVSPRVSSITYAQWLVLQGNQATGKEMRELEAEWRAAKEEQQRTFLAHQQKKIETLHMENLNHKHAMAWLKHERLQDAVKMKHDLERLWRREIARKKAFAGKARSKTAAAREQSSRNEGRLERKKKLALQRRLEASRQEKALRREAAAKNREDASTNAAVSAARVREETRPAVRQEGREMFQAQRDAMGEEGRQMKAINHDIVVHAKEQFLYEHECIRDEVRSAIPVARAARGQLAAQRKADAEAFRAKLDAERLRGADAQEAAFKRVNRVRNAIYDSRFATIAQSEEVFADPVHKIMTTAPRPPSKPKRPKLASPKSSSSPKASPSKASPKPSPKSVKATPASSPSPSVAATPKSRAAAPAAAPAAAASAPAPAPAPASAAKRLSGAGSETSETPKRSGGLTSALGSMRRKTPAPTDGTSKGGVGATTAESEALAC